MTREALLAAIRASATANAGRPLGARAFHAETGISRTELHSAGFARYNDAIAAAGFAPNSLRAAFDTDQMLAALAAFTSELGRFPNISDIKAARARGRDMPSYEAYFRLAGGMFSRLPSLLVEYCAQRPALLHVTTLLAAASEDKSDVRAPAGARVKGFVYLAKHGRDFKIGRSNDVTRRRRELALILPHELKHVHVIETDDPEGIERYWHHRFADRQIRGEWYQLTPDDVAAFKRRRYQ